MKVEKKSQRDEVAKCKITRLPASPTAKKKQKQQLNMTAEKRRLSRARSCSV
jgi:hypothetical protein